MPVPPPPLARRATEADLDKIGVSLARAFSDEPVWRFLAPPGDERFVTRAAKFFRRDAAARIRRGEVWTVDGCHTAALWSAPGAWRTTPGELASVLVSAAGLLRWRLVVALRALAAIERAHPAPEHWYLGILGTDPDHQGGGLGTAVLRPILDRCDSEGIPAYLESSKERNLAFYGRHGFVSSKPFDLPGGGPPVWPMWRDSR
jgi:GNAT superfamily N-acetyltransferase